MTKRLLKKSARPLETENQVFHQYFEDHLNEVTHRSGVRVGARTPRKAILL